MGVGACAAQPWLGGVVLSHPDRTDVRLLARAAGLPDRANRVRVDA